MRWTRFYQACARYLSEERVSEAERKIRWGAYFRCCEDGSSDVSTRLLIAT